MWMFCATGSVPVILTPRRAGASPVAAFAKLPLIVIGIFFKNQKNIVLSIFYAGKAVTAVTIFFISFIDISLLIGESIE
jgi:hypothetical protein